jgi:hypothetical protein
MADVIDLSERRKARDLTRQIDAAARYDDLLSAWLELLAAWLEFNATIMRMRRLNAKRNCCP